MDWINTKNRLKPTPRKRPYRRQSQLMLLACLPCLFIATWALLQSNLSGYLIAFLIIVLGLLVSYCIAANRQESGYQIRTLTNLIESMIHGDYSMRGRLQTDQAFHELLTLVNQLAETLSQHKLAVRESKLLLERILEQMDAMVLAVNDQGLIAMANASAKKLILNDEKTVQGKPIEDFGLGKLIVSRESGIIEFNQRHLAGEHLLLKEHFLSEGKRHQLFIITNAERLLMEKERHAWQRLLRVLSHEMNNSLTPVAAISQTMQKKLTRLEENDTTRSLLEGAKIINERANTLSDFIASYSQLSHLPQPNKTQEMLTALITPLFALFPDCKYQIDGIVTTELMVDKSQMEQVFINLFKNADEAMTQLDEKLVTIVCSEDTKWQHIYIRDSGKGIKNTDNVLVPFYTTKPNGSGIGLALCRQILFNHNGMLKIRNRQDIQGAEIILSFPKL